jgi:hypothetical protein
MSAILVIDLRASCAENLEMIDGDFCVLRTTIWAWFGTYSHCDGISSSGIA